MWRKICGWGLHPLHCRRGGGSGPTPKPYIKTKSIVVISIKYITLGEYLTNLADLVPCTLVM